MCPEEVDGWVLQLAVTALRDRMPHLDPIEHCKLVHRRAIC